MVAWSIFLFIDMLLWLFMVCSVMYVLVFALASILPRPPKSQTSKLKTSKLKTFLVLYPAYHEDSVICTSAESFLKQDYPSDKYQVIVISDHMTDETNQRLSSLPITLLTPQFDKSSKARALQYAVHSLQSTAHRSDDQQTKDSAPSTIDYVVILDADNVVAPDFLSRLNSECQNGYRAIQCHRTAKNSGNDIAELDGLSEEINNSIFRRGHNRVGLSSALIGSGMCLDFEWFASHVDKLSTAGEDKELEAMLLWERVHVHFAEDILVKDEKVSGSDNFQRQRLRWMTAQIQCFMAMIPRLPRAIATFRIDYIDKTIQQALIPRSILLVVIPLMAILAHIITYIVHRSTNYELSTMHYTKWWLLLLALVLALFIAIPNRLRTRALITKALALPALALHMIRNIVRIERKNTDFLHTEHG